MFWRGVDVILAEDTRVSGKLLAAHGVTAKLQRYDEHAAERARPNILASLAAGGRIALISDAGTPLVNDPGYRLVQEALAQHSAVIPIPGPSAVLAALVVAGLPTDRFMFAGFPPPRPGARSRFLEELAPVRATLIFFEGGSRLAASLADMARVLGPRTAAVARELTKLHETIVRGHLDELARDPRFESPKGEMVVLVAPGEQRTATAAETETALVEALSRMGPSAAAAAVARVLHLPRRDLYAQALALNRR